MDGRSVEHRKLLARARRAGIQPEFTDASGQRRRASTETLRALLDVLEPESNPEPRLLPETIVQWQGRATRLRINAGSCSFPPRMRGAVIVNCGDGVGTAEREIAVRVSHAAGQVLLYLPSLPDGYHELRLEGRGFHESAMIISAPRKAFARTGARDWGVFVPMYAVHSDESWGAGTLSDWQRLGDWLAEINESVARPVPGRVVMATLPLLGAFLEKWKCEPSPYSPATRLFWNEFCLDVMRVLELAFSRAARCIVSSTSFQNAIRASRRNECVDYQVEAARKRRVLEVLAAEFFAGRTPRRREFEEFCGRRGELERYAAFRAVAEERGAPWTTWPARLRHGTLRREDYDVRRQRYHLFVQWLVQEQIDEVLARGRDRGIMLYLDLPLGVNPDGYDVWAHQECFLHGTSVGAPPDAFFTKGQNWGFPPLHPGRIREARYRYVIDYLRFQMRHTGLLRLDHVMGLHRLWWIPPGASAADGAYVSYNAEELYAILSVESHRHGTTLVGENLGTVPPIVNRSMRRHGIRTMFVAQYAARPTSRDALPRVPADTVASLNTHDMPTWASFWKGQDIAERVRLGLRTAREARRERRERKRLCSAISMFLRRRGALGRAANARSVLAALVSFMGSSDAELALISLEDLWLEMEPQNTPGTCGECLNWRRKLRKSLADLTRDPRVKKLLQQLVRARASAR